MLQITLLILTLQCFVLSAFTLDYFCRISQKGHGLSLQLRWRPSSWLEIWMGMERLAGTVGLNSYILYHLTCKFILIDNNVCFPQNSQLLWMILEPRSSKQHWRKKHCWMFTLRWEINIIIIILIKMIYK